MLISARDASIHAYQSEKIKIDLTQNDLFFWDGLSGWSVGSCQNDGRPLLDLPVLNDHTSS
jgi:hypothetical protein